MRTVRNVTGVDDDIGVGCDNLLTGIHECAGEVDRSLVLSGDVQRFVGLVTQMGIREMGESDRIGHVFHGDGQ